MDEKTLNPWSRSLSPGYWVPQSEWGHGNYFYYGPFPTKESAIEAADDSVAWLVFCDAKGMSFVHWLSTVRKAWKTWFDDCEHCGGDAQVLSADPRRGWVLDGELLRCVSCYCLGHVEVSEAPDSVSGWWPEEPCAKCYREME